MNEITQKINLALIWISMTGMLSNRLEKKLKGLIQLLSGNDGLVLLGWSDENNKMLHLCVL